MRIIFRCVCVCCVSLLMVGCNQLKEEAALTDSDVANLQFNAEGINTEGKVLHFKDSKSLEAFTEKVNGMDIETYALFASQEGITTDYSNYIMVLDSAEALLAQFEASTGLGDDVLYQRFQNFKTRFSDKAIITDEGIEPLTSFTSSRITNSNGKYRVGSQEYKIESKYIFSYPVGKDYLVHQWDGKLDDVSNELFVSKIIQMKSSSNELEDREERQKEDCFSSTFNENKRIRTIWISEANRTLQPLSAQAFRYTWSHTGCVLPQFKRAAIWWRDKRHVGIKVTGIITDVCPHPAIAVFRQGFANLEQCDLTRELSVPFSNGPSVNSSILTRDNGFGLNISVVGSNRENNCNVIQASCSLEITNPI